MREIKLRAWDSYHQKMVYPSGEDMTDKVTSASLLAAFNDGGMEDIMQFTGLKDSKGKEVYEGDIVEWFRGSGKDKDRIIETIEIPDVFYKMSDGAWSTEQTKIIGNIYENPKLLTQEKK